MKETKLYHTALELSLLDGKDLKTTLDERIAKLPAYTNTTRIVIPWPRALMTAAAAMLVLAAAAMAIPSSRAEVLSWLGIITRPQEYLTADPAERPPIEALDNMIVPAQSGDTRVKVLEIDRTDSRAVNSEGALQVAALLQRDVRIALGDTMFDGDTAYVSLRLGGTAALPLLESWTGGSTTLVKVDPKRMVSFFAGGPDSAYLSGEKEMYWRPETEVVLELEDGTRLSNFLNQAETDALKAHIDALEAKNFHWDELLPEEQAEIDRMNLAFLEEHEIVAVTEISGALSPLTRNADDDGTVSAKVFLNVYVEEDYDLPVTELLQAEVGTVRFSVTGYQAMETRTAAADGNTIVWQGDAVFTYMELVDKSDPTKAATDWNNALQVFTNRAVLLDGMTLEALPGAYADDLGIYDLKVRIILPETVQSDARAAWTNFASMCPIRFDILVDGQTGSWYAGGFGLIENADGSFTYEITDIRGLDLETIRNVRTITLVPVLRYVVGFEGPNGAYVALPLDTRTENPRSGDAWMGQKFETTAYPEYALVFTLG